MARKRKSFQAQVVDQVRLVEHRMIAVQQQATIDVIDLAQRPRGQPGGVIPVVTGFLRNSGRLEVGNMPKGPIRGEKGESYNWDTEQQADVILKISMTAPGDKIYFGWTAVYARRMEARYGFQRRAAQKWQEIVRKAAVRAVKLIRA